MLRNRAPFALSLLLAGSAALSPGLARDESFPGGEAAWRQARTLLREGDASAAESLVRSALERAPNDPGGRLLLGRILVERGAFEEATGHLDLAAELGARPSFLAHHLLGRARLALGDAGAASAAFDRAVRAAPRFAPARVGRARAAMRLARFETGVSDLEAARSLEGVPSEAGLLLAEAYLFSGRRAEAAEVLAGLGESSDGEGRAQAQIRMLRLAAGVDGNGEAKTELEALLASNFGSARAFTAWGLAQLAAGRSQEAMSSFRAALEMDDADPVPWLGLRGDEGSVQVRYPEPFPELPALLAAARRGLEAGDREEARRLLRDVLGRRPHHVGARLLWLADAQDRGALWEALEEYRSLLRLFPGLSFLKVGAARVARSMGAADLGERWASEAVEAAPEDARRRYLLALLQEQQGRHEVASRSCREAIALGLEEAPVYLTLGLIEFERMNTAEAVAAYRRALELDPAVSGSIPRFAFATLAGSDAEAFAGPLETRLRAMPEDRAALFALATFRSRAGELEEAAQLFERLATLEPDDARVQSNLGSVLLRAGRRGAGEAVMARFRALKDAEAEEWERQNRVYFRRLEAQDASERGDHRAALRLYAGLARSARAQQEDRLGAGRSSLALGDSEAAYEWFEKALGRSPYDLEALRGLADAAEALGRWDAAKQVRHKAALLSFEENGS